MFPDVWKQEQRKKELMKAETLDFYYNEFRKRMTKLREAGSQRKLDRLTIREKELGSHSLLREKEIERKANLLRNHKGWIRFKGQGDIEEELQDEVNAWLGGVNDYN